MSSNAYNLRNPAVKRILQEVKELERHGSSDFIARAIEDNIFEWHFVLRGSSGTPYEGGVYHGRILLPPDYPMKPPSFMMLTPNGRFQTNTKICLSISSHHPEHWQPSWSVRTALTALAAFMPTPGNGAIGSLDTPEVERRKLASESRSFIPSFGSPERQALSAEMHRCMLAVEEKALAGGAGPCEVGAPDPPGNGSAEEARGSEPPEKPSGARPPCEEDSTGKDAASSPQEQPSGPSGQPPSPATAPPPPLSAALPDPDAPDAAAMPPHGGGAPGSHARRCESEDKGLTWLACALSVAIAALLLRKLFAYMDAPIDELQHL